MNKRLYWKQQYPLISLNLVCMIVLALFLRVNGNNFDSIALILLVWFLILAAYLMKKYMGRMKQMDKLMDLVYKLEERYLISEVMEKPQRADDQIYYQLLKLSGKSMLEQIETVKRERMEYKEYIEQWVHEIKTPITAMKLICENHRYALTNELLVELEKTNRYTEQALYYARSEHTEKDYLIREIRLFDVVHQAIAENKYLLRQYNICIDLAETEESVYSDEKWLCFILNQMIVNAVKYRSELPAISFYTESTDNEITLCIVDNGLGISQSDLPRIFEKGFTGENGRNATQNATGIGLYLCKKLCDKLDIGISATSSGKQTNLRLSFHINDYIHLV